MVRIMADAMCHEPGFTVHSVDLESPRSAAATVLAPTVPGGLRPVWNDRQDLGLVLSGYELTHLGACADDTARDPEIERGCARAFFEAYDTIGNGVFARLNGWFAGVLLDRRSKRVLLFNDRFGIQRLYVHQAGTGLAFASEAKALLAAWPELRTIAPASLAEYFALGCTMQGRTLFPGIQLLPPGSLWTVAPDGSVTRQRYFDPATWEQQTPLSQADYTAGLIEKFANLLPHYIRPGAHHAMSLTGGLDSRMVLAWAKAAPGSMPTYSFCGPLRECADVRIARKLATTAGQSHTSLTIGPEFFRDFPTLAAATVHLSDGTMDISGAVELHVNRRAREIAPLRITGNYGSEILRANVAFRPRSLDRTLFDPGFCTLLDRAAQTYFTEARGHPLSFIAFKQVPWHHYGRLSIEQSQLAPRSPFLDNDLVAHTYRVPVQGRTDVRPVLDLIQAGSPVLAAIPTDRALHHGQNPLTAKLRREWVEFTAKAEYAYDYGMPAWLARSDHVLRGLHLERLFLGRHKFYHFRLWYKNELRDFLRESSAQMQSAAPFLRDGVVQRLVNEHISGRANHTVELHKLLSVGLLLRTLKCSL